MFFVIYLAVLGGGALGSDLGLGAAGATTGFAFLNSLSNIPIGISF